MIYELLDEKGTGWMYFNPITFKFMSDAYKGYPHLFLCPAEPEKAYTSVPEVLKLVVGQECNYRCKYCRQGSWRDICEVNAEKVKALLASISSMDFSKLERVEYWGGEPFLYWPHIYRIHNKIQEWAGRPIKIHLTTNGSLLTAEIVKQIRQLGPFIYKLSHDGPGQHLRSGDVLADTNGRFLHNELYQQAKATQNLDEREQSQFYINTVLTRDNYNPSSIVTDFQNLFDEDIIIRKMEPAIPYNTRANDWAILPEDYRDFEETIYTSVVYGNIVKNVLEYQQQWTLFQGRYYDEKYRYNPYENKCAAAQRRTLCLDMEGHILPCQVYTAQEVMLGQVEPYCGTCGRFNIEDFPRSLKFMHYPGMRHEPGFNCRECPVVSMCRGVCSYLPTNDFTKRNCQVRYHTYKALFRAFMKFKFNLDIVDFKPV